MITPFDEPFKPNGGIAVLRGNLAPDGAVIKPSAATPDLLRHRGRAVVFENIEDFHARIDDPTLDIDENCVMVLQELRAARAIPAWPRSATCRCRPSCCSKGVTDMVRISDARMSGTAYGTVVLHVAPEAAAGGPLALVRDGDMIELDVAQGRLQLHGRRRRTRRAPSRPGQRPGRSRAAATRSTSSTCCRPNAAPTSTSWSAQRRLVPRDNH